MIFPKSPRIREWMLGGGVFVVAGIGAILTVLGFIWMAVSLWPQGIIYQLAMMVGGVTLQTYGMLFWCVCEAEESRET